MRLGLVGHYLINKAYYATVLCENKENVEMDCEGSCRLKRELKEVNEPITGNKKMPLRDRFEISAFTMQSCFNVLIPPSNCTLLYNRESNQAAQKSISDIFQPPERIVFS